MSKVTETELAEHVVKYLEGLGFNVYKEVQCGSGYADIVAEKNGIMWCIETKTSLSDQLLDQAIARTKEFHYVSVAVPCSKKYGRADVSFAKTFVMEQFGIGLLVLRHGYYEQVEKLIEPKITRTYAKYRKKFVGQYGFKNVSLYDEQKVSKAGSKSGEQLTSFKITVIRVAYFLKEKGGAYDFKKLISELDQGLYHYRTPKALKDAILRGLNGGYMPEFKYENGILSLTEAGTELLQRYNKV